MGDPIGNIKPPEYVTNFGADPGAALGTLINIFMNILVVGGGVYAVFNFILAGYAFMAAGDDPKAIQGAWAKIYQTIIGVVFIAGSLLIAALVGVVIFKDPMALIKPVIKTSF